ncbi:MAG: nicotinate-nucleotide adenylyltransferase [Clostridiales bacterium]|jgi:nicotinate-nucleotide adenylyltransferase|nr:nicotinate-nucleotide adenylyltransferase [Clostridiales bacterium]MDK2991132.1 nicotinate-nucleotide adenylyltransferase [Clostridiales bacterium]
MHRIGLMGGTFDPIHYGHLVTAEEIRDKFNLEKVIFVPSGHPPHKIERHVSDQEHRYLMTFLATAPNPFFEVSRMEIDRQGPTYTIDTIKQFKAEYGDEYEFYFITGADAIFEILTWKDAEQLLGLCEFIAATRPGFNNNDIKAQLEHITSRYGKEVYSVEVPSLAISSTDIRQRIREGRPIKYLLPESVEYYIKKCNLYIKRDV